MREMKRESDEERERERDEMSEMRENREKRAESREMRNKSFFIKKSSSKKIQKAYNNNNNSLLTSPPTQRCWCGYLRVILAPCVTRERTKIQPVCAHAHTRERHGVSIRRVESCHRGQKCQWCVGKLYHF